MNKTKSYYYLAVIFVLFVLYMCFFQMEKNEISDIYIIRVLGIDKDDKGYTVTALYNDNGQSPTDSDLGGSGSIQSLYGEGDSVYSAFEDMKQKSTCNMTIAHTSFYLIGESAARNGLKECLDYIARDQTVKTNASVYLLQSEKVKNFLVNSIGEELFIHEDLDDITVKQTNQLRKTENTILHILNNLEDTYNTMFLPYLIHEERNLYPGGYAIFKENKLYEYLDYDTSLTIDLLANRLRYYPIYLSGAVGLEAKNYHVFMTIDKDKPVLHIKINLVSNLLEDVVKVNTNSNMQNLEIAQDEYLKNKINEVIALSKEYNTDLLGIKRIYAKEYGGIKEFKESDWESFFYNAAYQLELDTKISKNNVLK